MKAFLAALAVALVAGGGVSALGGPTLGAITGSLVLALFFAARAATARR